MSREYLNEFTKIIVIRLMLIASQQHMKCFSFLFCVLVPHKKVPTIDASRYIVVAGVSWLIQAIEATRRE